MQSVKLLACLFTGFLLLSAAGRHGQVFQPPGMVPVVDNFFVDETEISNINWREYLSWVKRNQGLDTFQYAQALPDTTVWERSKNYSEVMVENYLRHPAFDAYPVVGVNHDQAKAYCLWRTDRVREMLAANYYDKPRIINIARRLQYRLPTKTEWELVARLNDVNQAKLRFRSKKKNREDAGYYNLNYFNETLNSTAMYTSPGRSHAPGTKGVYNLIGNVAEMVQEPGVAKGGAFIHTETEALSGRDFPYEQQDYWLGFRCVCEILDK